MVKRETRTGRQDSLRHASLEGAGVGDGEFGRDETSGRGSHNALYTYIRRRALPGFLLQVRTRWRLLPSCCRRDRPRRRIHADGSQTGVHDWSVGRSGWSVWCFNFARTVDGCLREETRGEKWEVERREGDRSEMLPRLWDRKVLGYAIQEQKGVEEGREISGCKIEVWSMHSLALRLKMLALVHGQAASSAAEAVALRAELTAVADFAVQLALVLGAVCRVEQFAAKTCNTRSSPVVGDYDVFLLLLVFANNHRHRRVPIITKSLSTQRRISLSRRGSKDRDEAGSLIPDLSKRISRASFKPRALYYRK